MSVIFRNRTKHTENVDSSVEAIDEAYKVVLESLRLYALNHNMTDNWISEMSERLTNSFVELKAAIYLEDRCGEYFTHANNRIIGFSYSKLYDKNIGVFNPNTPNPSHHYAS